jgi:hypothetical protein
MEELTSKIYIATEVWQAGPFITGLWKKSKCRSDEKDIENFGIARN